MNGEVVIPGDLIFQAKVGVRRARVGDDEDSGAAEALGLRAKRERTSLHAQPVGEERAVDGHAVETSEVGAVLLEASDEPRRPLGEVARRQRGGVPRGTLDDVGEAEAKARQSAIVFWTEVRPVQALPDRHAQPRTRESRPEPIRLAGK